MDEMLRVLENLKDEVDASFLVLHKEEYAAIDRAIAWIKAAEGLVQVLENDSVQNVIADEDRFGGTKLAERVIAFLAAMKGV